MTVATSSPLSMLDPRCAAERPWVRQHLRVPKSDGSLYARPELSDAEQVLASNRELFDAANPNLQGRSLQRLRAWARQSVLEAAVRYTSALRGVDVAPVADPSVPLIVGGHQPALFHPGVWAKNFAVAGIAARAGGIPLHLVVDNDTLPGTRLIVPSGPRERPVLDTIAVDVERPAQPWEEARVLDRGLFESFARRAGEALKPWGVRPMAIDLWQDAVAGAHLTAAINPSRRSAGELPGGSLRDAFTTIRHRLENRWGLQNLEVPLSHLCQLDPFLWFTGHILANLPRFREVYNTALGQYRRINRVRSRTHPVPDLKEENGWLEAPFWVWREGDQVRGRLMARQEGRCVLLSDGRREFARLKLAPDMDACCAVEGLREMSQQGIRLRTRALTTTLFSRLCLADVFVHGIGGAKYDEMTDRICSRFFGVCPPEFLTVSATVHLPIGPAYNVTAADERRLETLLRDLEWNGDRHLSSGWNADADTLRAERLALRNQREPECPPGMSCRKVRHRARVERFHRFQDLARRIAAFTADQQQKARAELAQIRQQRAANSVFRNREYSFVMFPEEKLRGFMQGIAGIDPRD
ncbi:MAG: hypothetical protein IT428_07740 [Planctomycetaceae bacterium]|nr:hypothetical protein [Planctomycetaceae bacterium]